MNRKNELSTLSIVMIVKNEAHQIERALKKLDWVDELVIIDSFSTDGTMDICRKYASRIYQLPWEGFAKQKQRTIDLAKGQWIFSIDVDQVISDELRREILMILPNTDKSGFWIPRKTLFSGRWSNHPDRNSDYQMRLFKKDAAFVDQRAAYEGISVHGDAGRLRNVLYHYPTFSHHLEKINYLAGLAADITINKRAAPPYTGVF